MNIIVIILVLGGIFFVAVGTLGLLRFPDFYTRAHATGKCDTLGMLLILLGLTLYAWSLGWWLVGGKLLVIALFIFLANPTATHALIRAAFLSGIKPWSPPECFRGGG
ncbi:MAG: monovalent cation/H(+) antiporter subunit G, partial [Planctomycetota bacterium]|nr:monovalent cation/H(+) antiporter subunit G [Planctomycetota bacterium]